jgi:hypothetical protein
VVPAMVVQTFLRHQRVVVATVVVRTRERMSAGHCRLASTSVHDADGSDEGLEHQRCGGGPG